MIRKRLKDCENIFLDSGVIIDRLKVDLSGSSDIVKARIEQIRQFFDNINSPSFPAKKIYQISSISIAEIFHLDNNQSSAMEGIVSAFQSHEVEVYSFDIDAAIFHNVEFYEMLGNKAIAELKQDVNYPISPFARIEDRIRKDIFIVATAKMYKADIVLTNDSGFQVLCDRLDVPCHLFTGNPNDFLTSRDGKIIYDFA